MDGHRKVGVIPIRPAANGSSIVSFLLLHPPEVRKNPWSVQPIALAS